MDEISAFENFFRGQLLGAPDLVALVGARCYNSTAPAGALFPFCIFTVVPLDDFKGQARTSIFTRLLVDVKIVSSLPLPDGVSAAVGELKEYFRRAQTFEFEDFRISVWHKRPIAYSERGASASEQIVNRGGTFMATMSRV